MRFEVVSAKVRDANSMPRWSKNKKWRTLCESVARKKIVRVRVQGRNWFSLRSTIGNSIRTYCFVQGIEGKIVHCRVGKTKKDLYFWIEDDPHADM